MNKRGLELSINFIVIIIISLVVFMFGIYLFTQIFAKGEEFTDIVSQDTEHRLQSLLIKGNDILLIPDFVQSIEKNKVYQFPMGIKSDTSRCSGGPSEKYKIETEFDMAVDAANNEMQMSFDQKNEISNWIFQSAEYEIMNNERKVIGIPVRLGRNAQDGATYVFNVKVLCSNGNQYGDIQKVYAVAK